jgi:tetratricopeptide (TPR) repeat protein
VLQLASARFAVGQDYRAVELLDPLIESTSSPNLLLQIGKLYFRNLLYRQAAAPLERAWELSKPSYETGMYLALTRYQLEQYAECRRILEQIRPDSAAALEYHVLTGSVLARLGNWEEARRALTRAVASAENRADGYLNLGMFWLERGDRQRAWEQLEKGSRLMTPGTKVLYKLGTRGNCDALSPPRGIEPKSQDRAEFYANLAESFHKTHHWISALELFLLALEEDPRLRAPYGGIGLICQELGSPEVGKSFLQRGIELHPKAADLHFYLGTIHYALGRFDDAISSYLRALELDGPNPPARHLLFLGIAQAGASGAGQDRAKQSFLRALESDPQLALAHYELGKWYLKNHEFDLAERSLQQAIELDPHLLGAYYQYGLACTRNGKPQKGQELMAAFQCKKALRERASPHQTEAEKELATPDVR